MGPYRLLRPLLFGLDAETAHDLTLALLRVAGSLPPVRAALRRVFSFEDPRLERAALGLHFRNPLGLAAGYDKNGVALEGLACLGFGHLEIGTTTPRPQTGNPRPRIFRLPEDQGLINRMGFPNGGAEALVRRLRRGRPRDVIIGVNIGKGVDTPLEAAAEDYRGLLSMFHPLADYLVVNVSSPNTVGLRRLQARDLLESLLRAMTQDRIRLREADRRQVPILVKLAPDLNREELEDAVGAVLAAGMDGIIATNTTLDRSGLMSPRAREAGGLSGRPLRERASTMVREVVRLAEGRRPVIGVGGIAGPGDARAMLDAGAVLVQLYTGLVYQGPGLPRAILQGLIGGPWQSVIP